MHNKINLMKLNYAASDNSNSSFVSNVLFPFIQQKEIRLDLQVLHCKM